MENGVNAGKEKAANGNAHTEKEETKEGSKKGEKQKDIGFLQLVSIVKKSVYRCKVVGLKLNEQLFFPIEP